MKKSYRLILAVSMAVIAIAAAYFKMGIFFETNDDRIISEILSGAITYTPDAYVQIISYLLSAPLALLYKMVNGIPWYGGCLILFHLISYIAINGSILSRCNKRFELLFGIILCVVIFLINLYSIGLIQWTSTAALLALAGYIILISKFNVRAVLVFAGFELLAFLLRDEAMLMIQPLGGAVFLGLFFSKEKWRQKEQRKLIFKWALAIAGVFVIGITSRWIVYRSEDWKTADAYYDARVKLVDYYGIPDYMEVKEILDRYQITQTEYEGFAKGIMIGSNINANCLRELAKYAKSKNAPAINWPAILRESVMRFMTEDSLSGNRFAGILWICMLFWIIVTRNKTLIVPAAGLIIARTFVWGYVIYKGRMPARVTYPLFFAEIVFLLFMIWATYTSMSDRTFWRQGVALCICGIVVLNGYGIGQRQYRYVDMENKSQAIYIRGYNEIKEYCVRNPERRYILDSFSFSFYKGSALETSIYKPANGIYAGAWISQSPIIKDYEKEYLGENWEDFYVIVYDDGQPQEVQETYVTVRYYTEKTGKNPVVSDKLTVSHGGSYLIWHFGGEEID